MSTLELFQTILADQKSLPREQPYKDLISLINYILRQFFKALEKDSFLAVEVNMSTIFPDSSTGMTRHRGVMLGRVRPLTFCPSSFLPLHANNGDLGLTQFVFDRRSSQRIVATGSNTLAGNQKLNPTDGTGMATAMVTAAKMNWAANYHQRCALRRAIPGATS